MKTLHPDRSWVSKFDNKPENWRKAIQELENIVKVYLIKSMKPVEFEIMNEAVLHFSYKIKYAIIRVL